MARRTTVDADMRVASFQQWVDACDVHFFPAPALGQLCATGLQQALKYRHGPPHEEISSSHIDATHKSNFRSTQLRGRELRGLKKMRTRGLDLPFSHDHEEHVIEAWGPKAYAAKPTLPKPALPKPTLPKPTLPTVLRTFPRCPIQLMLDDRGGMDRARPFWRPR